MIATEPVISQAVATVAPVVPSATVANSENSAPFGMSDDGKPLAGPAIVTLPPVATVRDGNRILSKKEALTLPANEGLARRTIEKAIIAAWRECAKESAAVVSSLSHDCATAGGAVVIGAVTKSGDRTIRLLAAPKARKESAAAKIARLEAELAALKGNR